MANKKDEEFNAKLVDLVREYVPLYDVSAQQHRDAVYRVTAWKEIAAGMGPNGKNLYCVQCRGSLNTTGNVQ